MLPRKKKHVQNSKVNPECVYNKWIVSLAFDLTTLMQCYYNRALVTQKT